ncbi:hypothetical protein LJC59_00105 [Desulfovibrio sp. OttesenSCG-928-A18]|nr:hypothetical protein [Desulfovibrio sp. OttesenSCG-928-A18]
MPDWYDLHAELRGQESHQDALRRKSLRKLAHYTKRNVIIYYSGWLQKGNLQGVAFGITDADKNGFMTVVHKLDRAKGLDLVLHTPGGNMAATESLIHYLRSMFGSDIRAIVPQIAMSGGSMIACASKEIIMGAQSNIGPFDPQIGATPSQAILADLKRAAEEMSADQRMAYIWQPIITKYDLGFFDQCENASKMADEVVRKSLRECMFVDDTDDDAKAKIDHIIKTLGSNAATHMHARHIHKERAKELGLKITDMEKDNKLQDLILTLHHSCILTFEQTPAIKIIENHEGRCHIGVIAPQMVFPSIPPPPSGQF